MFARTLIDKIERKIVANLVSLSLDKIFLLRRKAHVPKNQGNNQAERPKIPKSVLAVKIPN
jgi:hypothetical protein